MCITHQPHSLQHPQHTRCVLHTTRTHCTHELYIHSYFTTFHQFLYHPILIAVTFSVVASEAPSQSSHISVSVKREREKRKSERRKKERKKRVDHACHVLVKRGREEQEKREKEGDKRKHLFFCGHISAKRASRLTSSSFEL